MGRLRLGVGVKTSLICAVVKLGCSGSFRVSAGVKTSLVIDSENKKIEGENFHVK